MPVSLTVASEKMWCEKEEGSRITDPGWWAETLSQFISGNPSRVSALDPVSCLGVRVPGLTWARDRFHCSTFLQPVPAAPVPVLCHRHMAICTADCSVWEGCILWHASHTLQSVGVGDKVVIWGSAEFGRVWNLLAAGDIWSTSIRRCCHCPLTMSICFHSRCPVETRRFWTTIVASRRQTCQLAICHSELGIAPSRKTRHETSDPAASKAKLAGNEN